jgi:uncharacterized protein
MAIAPVTKKQHPKKDLELACQIVLKGLAGYPVRIFLFGSRAIGQAARTSDIDIAVLPEGPLPDAVIADIREQLEESPIIYAVDLVDLSSADITLRECVLNEGIEWSA